MINLIKGPADSTYAENYADWQNCIFRTCFCVRRMK